MRVRVKGISGEVTGFLVSMEHNGAVLACGQTLSYYDVAIRDDEDPRITIRIAAVPGRDIELLNPED